MSAPARPASASIPPIGLAVAGVRGSGGIHVVSAAIDDGFRLIVTDPDYDNDGTVGAAIAAAAVPRDLVTVATRLPASRTSANEATKFVEEFLLRTQLEHIDLMLVPWIGAARSLAAWHSLAKARVRGLVSRVGVAGFGAAESDALLEATGDRPAVDKIVVHPLAPQRELRRDLDGRGVRVLAAHPTGLGDGMLRHPVLVRAAREEGLTPAQLAIAWSAARGMIPLPTARFPARQRENLAALDRPLAESTLAVIDRVCPDGPSRIETIAG
ncbi:MAG: aldo/keto reductase [Microbacterium ginsengisoli]|uniref:aldo/keto reductase n=1 Tax=Microbacterium TaxID=33882 RepID=UPI0006FE471C|nr:MULTISPECIES: aldo/keto reductase [unclassified Microbacterium]KQR96884.1 hypothetical protein ASF93_02630 [Microbacterium sp. Leaf347]MBN9198021.1 aldo/keto reductase [Microbacterium ginsengisoli]ODU72541.1 MAG: hypothetical protein ABT08_12585 [Microbacterium sp. SCN 71-21]OJU78573.1 MAG: hypothetical protein BGO15_13740 [Microbacterium sp. 71-23]